LGLLGLPPACTSFKPQLGTPGQAHNSYVFVRHIVPVYRCVHSVITKSWEGGWCFSSGVRGSLWGLSSVGGVVVVGVGDIGYPQPLRLLPAGAQGARPLSPNGCPSSSSLARALLRNTPYTLSPAQPTRAANANSRRSSIYRPRPKHTWHLIYAIWFQAVDAKGGLGSYDLACIDTTARGLTLWKLTDAIFAVTIL
jgi:hypothetical protein